MLQAILRDRDSLIRENKELADENNRLAKELRILRESLSGAQVEVTVAAPPGLTLPLKRPPA
jgi:hypothetical protein